MANLSRIGVSVDADLPYVLPFVLHFFTHFIPLSRVRSAWPHMGT
jgi:hypothetical protein